MCIRDRIMSIPVDMTDMDEGGKKEVVPKRAEWSVDCPTGRMVNSLSLIHIWLYGGRY